MKYHIGVDIGGSNLVVGIVNEQGHILKQESIPTRADRDSYEIIKDVAILAKEITTSQNILLSDIISMGIGSPGSIDKVNGIIIYANNLNFKDTRVREYLSKFFDFPIYLDNDANCAALGESVAGSGKGYKNALILTLGTGIGGGIVIDNKLYTGSFGGAGEIGHHVIVAGGEQCTCGRKGCLEAYSSSTALIREGKKAVRENPKSLILNYAGNDIDRIDGEIIFRAYDEGDEIATEIIENYIEYLSEGVTNAINILDPEIVVIGGGISRAGDSLFIPLREKVEEKRYSRIFRTEITSSSLGNDAGLIGAALLNE